MNYQSPGDPGTSPHADDLPPGAQNGEFEPVAKDRRWRTIVAVVVVVALLALAYLWYHSGDAAADDTQGEQSAQRVTVTAPGQSTIAGTISATGTLAARRTLPVGVVGEGGRVVSVNVEQGDWVRQGQVLVSIDRSVQDQQARSAAAQIEVARADAQLAQNNLDRALQLVDRGFISKADVDRLTATRDAAVARVKVAQAQLGELQARNARLNIYAPASGLVLERNVEPGQTVSPGGQPLITIAQGGELELLAQVGESDLAKLSPGVEAQVTPVGGTQTFTGQIWQIEPTIDPQTRQGIARVALSYDPALKPGGFASATINSGTVVAPRLPESAILSDDDGSYVYIVDKENKVRRRGVTTGIVTGEGIAVTSGLDGNERVVLRAGGFLNPGDTVEPVVER